MRSVMVHQFSQVPRVEIPRSSFDRSHGYKTTFNAGFLVPVFVDEVLPGDTYNCRMTVFARLATPLHPVMDNMFCDSFFFFVPNRLIWTHFVNMFGEQDNPTDTTSYLVPTMTSPAGGYLNGSLHDYMGLPTQVAGIVHSALHLRAYNLIWNQWFRDQNLQPSVPIHKDDGPDPVADYVLLRRGKRHDYFTSALPFPQKGPSVPLPLGQSAVIRTSSIAWQPPGLSSPSPSTFPAPGEKMVQAATGAAPPAQALGLDTFGNVGPTGTAVTIGSQTVPSNLYADLSTATAATINQLRQAFQIQRMYERDARGGTRYTELIQAHFGVTSPDARLQRPEYLGGGSTRIAVNPIAQTSATGTGGTTPLGNLGAMGTFAFHGNGFTKSFTEHGVLLGLISVRADLNYQQGLNRMWSRSTRFDFYWPALSHLGEQSVLNQEIFCQGPSVTSGTPPTPVDSQTFGYQERFAEYRYKPSVITGQFRSNFATPLDTWHLAQNFAVLPVLGSTFIQDNPPIDRVIAVTGSPHFLLDAYFSMRCARPMPVYGVPGMIDHF